MHRSAVVREAQRRRDGQQHRERLLHGELPAPRDHRAQVLPLEQLHHEVRRLALLAHVDDVDDVRVPQLRGHAPLAQEPRARLRVGGEVIVQHLQRVVTPERHLLRLEDRRRGAVPEELHDLVLAEARADEKLAPAQRPRAHRRRV